jgi:hypothetical protein
MVYTHTGAVRDYARIPRRKDICILKIIPDGGNASI